MVQKLNGAERQRQDRTGRARRESAGGEIKTERLKAEIGEESDAEVRPGMVRIVRIGATRFGRKSFLGKLADYASYYAGAIWRLSTMQPRPDRVIALTTPPYLSILARVASKLRGGDHAHWVMDLFPDVMVAHGILKESGIPHRLLALFAGWGFGGSRCAAVVTLGPDMAQRVGAHLATGRKVDWVPLWGGRGVESDRSSVISGDGDAGEDTVRLRRERGWRDDELVVMYSGNMGRGHRFEEIFGAAKLLAGSNGLEESVDLDSTARLYKALTRFVFFGQGKRKREVLDFAAKHPDCGLELHDYAPADKLREHLQSADIQLASLDGKWTGTMVPSKLQGIFEVGRPVIFIGSRESSIAKWILESGGGWVVEQGDVQGLVSAIDDGRDPIARRVRAEAAVSYAAKHFAKEANISRLVELFREERS